MNSVKAWARDLLTSGVSFLGGIKVYLICVAVGAAAGSLVTYKIMHNANLAAETKQAAATVRFVARDARINVDLGNLYLPQFVFLATETQRRKSEIPQHVTPEIDRTYPVPLGFVRVWNDAAHGPVPGPAAGSDADPSGVPLSDVASAHVADEGTLDVCRKSLTEWWDWYDRHKSLSEKSK